MRRIAQYEEDEPDDAECDDRDDRPGLGEDRERRPGVERQAELQEPFDQDEGIVRQRIDRPPLRELVEQDNRPCNDERGDA